MLRASIMALCATITIVDQALAEDRWLKFAAIMVCPRPGPGNCPALATGDHARIIGEANGLLGAYYQIESHLGIGFVEKRTFDEITTTENPKITAERERQADITAAEKRRAQIKAAKAECARRGQPKIGMGTNEVTASCWGKPLRIVKKTTATSIEESYIYDLGHVVRFRDGIAAEIIEAR